MQKLPPIIFSDIDRLQVNFHPTPSSLLPNMNNNGNEKENSNITIENIEEHSFRSKNEEHSAGVLAVPIGESYSLLDWGDESSSINTQTQTQTQTQKAHTQQPEQLNTSTVQDIMMLATTTSTTTFNSTSITSSLPILILKPAAEQQSLIDSRKFQELWSTSSEIFDGPLTNNLYEDAEINFISSRNILQNNIFSNQNILQNNQDISILSIESKLFQNLIMVMASGLNTAVSQNEKDSNGTILESPKGFKFFLYGIEEDNFLLGTKGSMFLAQLIFIPPFGDYSSKVTVKIKMKNVNDKTDLTNFAYDSRFGNLILKALSQLYVL